MPHTLLFIFIFPSQVLNTQETDFGPQSTKYSNKHATFFLSLLGENENFLVSWVLQSQGQMHKVFTLPSRI